MAESNEEEAGNLTGGRFFQGSLGKAKVKVKSGGSRPALRASVNQRKPI
jgi:hypothetical protein